MSRAQSVAPTNIRRGWALTTRRGTTLHERDQKPPVSEGAVLWDCMLAEQSGRTVWFLPRPCDRGAA